MLLGENGSGSINGVTDDAKQNPRGLAEELFTCIAQTTRTKTPVDRGIYSSCPCVWAATENTMDSIHRHGIRTMVAAVLALCLCLGSSALSFSNKDLIQPMPLQDVQLKHNSQFDKAVSLNTEYILGIDSDRMLKTFRWVYGTEKHRNTNSRSIGVAGTTPPEQHTAIYSTAGQSCLTGV